MNAPMNAPMNAVVIAVVIAARNIFRNLRRSVMTVSAITVGATAMLLFGEFFLNMIYGLQTNFVTQSGHISVFRTGYFDFGSGNPASYGIRNYEEVIETLKLDPVLTPLTNVVTPTVNLFGIAGNFEIEASKTFFAKGLVPEDFNKIRKWNEHRLNFGAQWSEPVMNSSDESHGIIGVGLARILGLCEKLKMTDCRPMPRKETAGTKERDFGSLGSEIEAEAESARPRLDLLASTASGAPNVVNFYVDRAVTQGVRELDDSFIGMHFKLAQQLLYGRNEKQAIAVVLQLHHTSDMDVVRARLNEIFREKNWDLEVRDLLELQPFYRQAVSMFHSIFGFIAAIMLVIVLFTVVNTMSMSVMERTNEIGTLRALGVKRAGITRQFVLEGSILGVIGATTGLILGSIVAVGVNNSGLTWLPPGQAGKIPLRVLTVGVEDLIAAIWFGLLVVATFAAWIPARRAAKMKIVDALGHV